ncbi:hypothetical protein [Microcoleus sp. CAWBG58]|uniref:hypothetical protein n=1 Tax=Microcoleus sp. CAWBG58 TaxID=2841651 RepID=UPI0025CD82A3|nr:hypothetical protein [Microcoleus sp. CAWBG58]
MRTSVRIMRTEVRTTNRNLYRFSYLIATPKLTKDSKSNWELLALPKLLTSD